MERLDEVKMLISVGTSYEAANLQPLLAPDSCEDIMGDELIDVRRITTGHRGNIPIAILEPTFRGPMPQYAAMRETLNRCLKAQQFYKTGGMAGAYDHGDIIVAAEATPEGTVVEDRVQDTVWVTRPGFPGLALKNAAFESPQPTRQVTLVTGAQLITAALPRPYEIEASGFLTALDRHGAFKEKNEIGIVGVITENFTDVRLKKKATRECFSDLRSFWGFFLDKLQ